MTKTIRFIELHLRNFTEHRNITVRYGDITKLSGHNGVGKTSIGTAPAWIFWGIDLFGRKWSPRPVTYEADVTSAAIIVEVDGVEIKFERGIDGGDNVFLVNDVPVKAREFEAAVASLFDRDAFMSSYHPGFFFGLHWQKQRELILRNTLPPARVEVLKHLPQPVAEKLDELLKKHSLDELQRIHGGTGGRKSKLEKEHIAAESRRKTLQEQLMLAESPPAVDLETAPQDIAKIDAAIAEIEASMAGADEHNRKIMQLQSKINSLLEKRDRMKAESERLKARKPDDHCKACGQPLQGDTFTKAMDDYNKTVELFRKEYDEVIAERKAAEAELAELQPIDVSEKMSEIRRWQEAKQAIQEAMREKERRQQLEQDVEKAKVDEAATSAALKESIFIHDAIKAYRAKEAELQADKVQSLFTRLQIRLHNVLKNGELEDAFVIQMDGKDYAQLSTGERIAAGLELGEVFYKQSEMIVPVFIDGLGEYTGDIKVYGQVITAQAVRGQELQIDTEDEA